MVADADDVPPITASPIPNCHWLLQFLTAEIYPSSLIQTFPRARVTTDCSRRSPVVTSTIDERENCRYCFDPVGNENRLHRPGNTIDSRGMRFHRGRERRARSFMLYTRPSNART